MKSLIILLFITFISSQINIGGYLFNYQSSCKGGIIQNKKCICPNNTFLFEYQCTPCVGGSIKSGKCQCPKGKFLELNECTAKKLCPQGYIKLYNNTCIKKCPNNQIRVGNKCQNCTGLTRKIESRNLCESMLVQIRRQVLKKPVIYLYPKETMDISIQLNLKNSKFTTIYPKFNEENTWKVRANPNGDILMNGKTYPYLFWEAKSYDSQNTNEGFIVSEENAEEFLEEKLSILGLNDKEKTDFITFWLPVLLKNKLSLCSFQSEKFFENMELDVNPKPDTMIRIFLTIKRLDAPINVKEQKLISVERKGYTVVEWGGSNF